MRTNIVIDDALVRELLELTGLRTKGEVVQLALESLRETRRQEGLKGAFGKLHWEGDPEQMRLDR